MNLAYRDFARIGWVRYRTSKTWDADRQSGEDHSEFIGGFSEIAREKGVIRGRKMRVDTTVVETTLLSYRFIQHARSMEREC